MKLASTKLWPEGRVHGNLLLPPVKGKGKASKLLVLETKKGRGKKKSSFPGQGGSGKKGAAEKSTFTKQKGEAPCCKKRKKKKQQASQKGLRQLMLFRRRSEALQLCWRKRGRPPSPYRTLGQVKKLSSLNLTEC